VSVASSRGSKERADKYMVPIADNLAMQWFLIRHEPAVAGASGQQLLPRGCLSTTGRCRAAMAYLNACRFTVGSAN
jgi:hypothetical protein